MMPDPEKHPATLVAQSRPDPSTGALIPPLYATSTYQRDPDNRYPRGWSYGRADNPTIEHPQALLNALEGGQGCLLFASGMAAATTVFLALSPGDHVIAPKVMYWGLRHWLLSFAVPWGLAVDLVDTSDLSALQAAIRPGRTKLVWLETPANPTWAIADIAAVAELAHRSGARLAVDGTAATPVLSRPLALGADLVMHSATKYLNGHTDLVAGALVTAQSDDLWTRLCQIRHDMGAILGPFEAWLLLRGMRTLFLRVERASATALFLAQHLRANSDVSAVLYPGLADHPGHEIARRQMQGGFGGMLSIRVKGGEAAAIATAARVSVWQRATSLGGIESLIEHRASIEGPSSPVPPDLLRLSTGIEHPADLLADLEQALASSTSAPRRPPSASAPAQCSPREPPPMTITS
jgi:cystathionine gamma-synthase